MEHLSAPARVERLHAWRHTDSQDDAPTLVAGGAFLNSNFQVANNIAQYIDGEWSPMAQGVIGRVLELCSPGEAWTGPIGRDLFVGGTLTRVGAINTSGVGRWDGSTWHTLGNGLNGTVTAIAAWDQDGNGPLPGEIVAGGSFTASGSTTLNRVGVWNGTSWRALDQGFNSQVGDLFAFDFDGPGPQGTRLIAAGNFTASGTRSTPGIARWNGVVWETLGTGIALSGTKVAMLAWDPDASGPALPQLVVSGDIALAGGVFTNGIARWDGSAWHDMSSGFSGPVKALTEWSTARDDSTPTRLIAATEDSGPGGDAYRIRVREWVNNSWQEICTLTTSRDASINNTISAITAWNDDGIASTPERLVLAGTISYLGYRRANNIVELLRCEQLPCLGDLTDDRVVDLTDLAVLLNRFSVRSPGNSADLDLDGTIGLGDLALLLSRFGTVCEQP